MTVDTKHAQMDVKDLKVQINTEDASMVIKVMHAVREELATQLALNVFGGSRFDHLVPTSKGSVRGDELRKRLVADVLSVFDTACINQSLKTLKVRMLTDEGVRH